MVKKELANLKKKKFKHKIMNIFLAKNLQLQMISLRGYQNSCRVSYHGAMASKKKKYCCELIAH